MLAHVGRPDAGQQGLKYWYLDEYLRLHGNFIVEWNHYIKGIIHCGIRLSKREDQLNWSWNAATGQVSAKLAYETSISTIVEIEGKW